MTHDILILTLIDAVEREAVLVRFPQDNNRCSPQPLRLCWSLIGRLLWFLHEEGVRMGAADVPPGFSALVGRLHRIDFPKAGELHVARLLCSARAEM